jgi:large subunit ribosomal protein L32e|tara:strand:- start:514 stop:1113 length:600 start_codon:yes stop_codon:yes gene_type:complete
MEGTYKMSDKLIELRKKISSKRPTFLKQKCKQKKRLANKWRKPRGSDSKIKVNRKDYPKKVKTGYRGPKEVRGLSQKGMIIINVKNVEELKNIKKDKEIVCIAKVGQRKKIEIVKACKEKSLQIINLKDPSLFLKQIEDTLKTNKTEKTKKEEEKKKKSEKTEEKKKEGIESKVEEEKTEEVKDQAKKEKDKLLTQREI